MPKRILLVSSSNFTANPRMLKEYLYFSPKHQVSVLKIGLSGWLSEIEKQVIDRYNIANVIEVNSPAKYTFPWFWLQFRYMSYRFLEKFYSSLKIKAFVSNKLSILLDDQLRQMKGNYDVIFAHTLGALYPAYHFSRKKKIPLTFDVEDYHPGEKVAVNPDREIVRREMLMKEIMPHLVLYNCASPLIGKAVEELIGPGKVENTYVSNSFSSSEFTFQAPGNGPLSMVWFSQNISFNRGLEQILEVMPRLGEKVSLTLIGNLNRQFETNYIRGVSNVTIIEPMEQGALHRQLGQYDVGLALEQRNADTNRNICLTNKLFAYFQSGLYILATATDAQKEFIEAHEGCGTLLPESEKEIVDLMEQLIVRKEAIRERKKDRFEKGRSEAWETQFELYEKILASI